MAAATPALARAMPRAKTSGFELRRGCADFSKVFIETSYWLNRHTSASDVQDDDGGGVNG